MSRPIDRQPDNYTVGMVKVYFSPLPANGDKNFWTDDKALADGAMGTTGTGGYVMNRFGNAVGTLAQIRENFYLGSLDSASLGGDVSTLEHTVSNLGTLEVDRVVVLDRPFQYTFSFDEPDVKNLKRHFIADETDLGLSLRVILDPTNTFQGSGTNAVTVFSTELGDPAETIDMVRAMWLGGGATGNPPAGWYGFIVSGTNLIDPAGAWANKNQYIAAAEIDFDANTIGTWKYWRPQGTALNGNYGSDTLIPINGTVLSVPDTDPPVMRCGTTYQWNAKKTLAWTGYGWYGSDPDFFNYAVMSTSLAYKRVEGCAVILMMTRVGRSFIHVIPRCTMIPDGTLDFAADTWITGSFMLNLQRDTLAKTYDRKPAQMIPFGLVQVFDMAPDAES